MKVTWNQLRVGLLVAALLASLVLVVIAAATPTPVFASTQTECYGYVCEPNTACAILDPPHTDRECQNFCIRPNGQEFCQSGGWTCTNCP